MIFAILLTVIDAIIDWWVIRRAGRRKKAGKKYYLINHPMEAGLFIAASVGGAMIVMNWYFILLAIGVRLLGFDMLLNALRGRSWKYVDQEDDAAWTDKILRKFNPIVVLGGRLLIFAASCYFYYSF